MNSLEEQKFDIIEKKLDVIIDLLRRIDGNVLRCI